MFKTSKILSIILSLVFFVAPSMTFAQSVTTTADCTGFLPTISELQLLGPGGRDDPSTPDINEDRPIESFGEVICIGVKIANFFFSLGFALATLFIIFGGVKYVTSMGNSDQVEGARNTIRNAVVGVIIILLATMIVNTIKEFAGDGSGGGGGGGGGGVVDTEKPTVPQNLTVSLARCGESYRLNWDASTDNVAVSGYRIFKNGSVFDSTSNTQWTSPGRTTANQTATFQVIAFDTSGNESAKSNSATATTPPAPTC